MQNDLLSKTATGNVAITPLPLYEIKKREAIADEGYGESQEAKADAGKPMLSLVPTQLVRDVAEVRMYGNRKYGSAENWKKVEMHRYVDALYRNFLAFLDDPESVDAESGIKHYKHMACNMAFICHMMAKGSK